MRGVVLRIAANFCLCFFLAIVLTGCEVTRSSVVAIAPGAVSYPPIVKGAPPMLGIPPSCSSILGSYALPKAYLHVKVESGKIETLGSETAKVPLEVRRHPDQAFVFCLDHVNSPLSADAIQVVKWAGAKTVENLKSEYSKNLTEMTPFLGAVLVNSTDYSAAIAQALIRAAMIALSGSAGFPIAPTIGRLADGPDQTLFGADLEFDPFDPRETAQSNARLRELGYCLIVESFTVRTQKDYDAYCDAPLRNQHFANPIAEQYVAREATPAEPMAAGVMYRPRKPYRVHIYRKQDPNGPSRWLLQYTQVVSLENLSPVLSLQIDRTAFGGKRAALLFEEGTLTNACLSKTSEINGALDIPVQAFKDALSIPANIFAVRINSIDSQIKLIGAREELAKVRKNIAAAKIGEYSGNQSPPNPFPGPINGVDTVAKQLEEFKAVQAVGFSSLGSAFFSDAQAKAICADDINSSIYQNVKGP